ncbi:MAG: sulfite exporter TauE/SafE family protein [Akkermansiaceae bacterium]|nr:sulfite exporter TauE/SafE family protein [Luteolibacter sp.]
MKVILIAIVVGLAAGLISALCGVGGGILMVPAFVLALGFTQQQAIATSLAVIVITSLVASSNNLIKAGHLIDWKIVAIVGIASAIAAWFGTDLMHKLSSQTLTRIFGVVLLVIGAKMLFKG